MVPMQPCTKISPVPCEPRAGACLGPGHGRFPAPRAPVSTQGGLITFAAA